MPITYEPSSAFAPAIAGFYGAATTDLQVAESRARMRQQQQSDYLNAGMREAEIKARMYTADADRGQAAINNRDSNAIQSAQFGASLMDRANERAHQENMLAQRADAQQVLMQTELSQQDKIRMQRMKNSISAIEADDSLSPDEKSALLIQVKTGLNPLENRLAKQKIEQERMAKEQMAERIQFESAGVEQSMDASTGKMPNRFHFEPDPQYLAQKSAEIRAELQAGGLEGAALAIAGFDEKKIAAMARQEAIKEGKGTTYFQKAPRQWERVDGGKGAKAGGKDGQTDEHPSGLDAGAYRKALDAAYKEAADEQKMTTTDSEGKKTNVHPPSAEWKENRVKEIMARHGLPATFEEYKGQAQQEKKPGSVLGLNKRGGQGQQSAKPDLPKPFQWDKPETPEHVDTVRKMTALDKRIAEQVKGADARQNASAAWSQAKLLLQKHGSEAGIREAGAEAWKDYTDAIDEINGALNKPAPESKKAAEWWSPKPGMPGAPGVPAPAGPAPDPRQPLGQRIQSWFQ